MTLSPPHTADSALPDIEVSAAGFHVIEQHLQGKAADPSKCEDALVVLPHVVAVVDGQTSKSAHLFGGLPGGVFAKNVLSDALRHLDPTQPPAQQVVELSLELRRAVELASPVGFNVLAPSDRPTASLMYFLPQQRLLVSVGDCQARVHGRLWHIGKESDKLLAGTRARVLRQHLDQGMSVQSLLEMDCDPGRAHILPLLRVAETFRNQVGSEFAFGVMDGTPIPLEHLRTRTLKPGYELVLATDGYPALKKTLSESEAWLSRALRSDPLCIDALQGTKPLTAGLLSFDDRAYVRVQLL